MEQAVARLAKLGEITPAYARSLTKHLMRICEPKYDDQFYGLDNPIRKALGTTTTAHPKEVWGEVAKKLLSKSSRVGFYANQLLAGGHDDHLSRGLEFHVPPKIYLDWVREDPKQRAAIAVPWLPVAMKNEDNSLRWDGELVEFIQRFW